MMTRREQAARTNSGSAHGLSTGACARACLHVCGMARAALPARPFWFGSSVCFAGMVAPCEARFLSRLSRRLSGAAVALALAAGLAFATSQPALAGPASSGDMDAPAVSTSNDAPASAFSDAGDLLVEGLARDVAATVNGEELPLSVLTSYVDSVRATIGSQTDAAWEAYLTDQGYGDPDAYWQALIDHYGREMVVLQRCDELGISASDEEIDEYEGRFKAMLGADTEESSFIWEAYLERGGYTEQGIRAAFAYQLRLQKLYETEVPREPASEEVVQRYAEAYASSYGLTPDESGAVDLPSTSEDVRAQIEQDATDFAWDYACERYVDELYAGADVVVYVAHQYDVPGQSHGTAGSSAADAGTSAARVDAA